MYYWLPITLSCISRAESLQWQGLLNSETMHFYAWDQEVCLDVVQLLQGEYRIGERTETSVTSPSFHYVITGVGR